MALYATTTHVNSSPPPPPSFSESATKSKFSLLKFNKPAASPLTVAASSPSSSFSPTAAASESLTLKSVPTKPIEGQKTGTSGIRNNVQRVHGRNLLFMEGSASDAASRRQLLAFGAILTPFLFLSCQTPASFAVENKKGFFPVTDKTDGYSFLYPFGWQEVVIEGQDKVFKDVIEPLESVSVNLIPTAKDDIRDLGSPQEVAETLIQKVLVPSSQKAKLIEATQHETDGKAYYTFEFVAKAPNFTRHALTSVCVGNGRFYTLTTGANERRWSIMKDRLHEVVDSFQIFKV